MCALAHSCLACRPRLHPLQFSHNPNTQALVQGAAHKEAPSVWAPVKRVDRLGGQGLVRQQLAGAGDAQLLAVLVLCAGAHTAC
jgi:hypothetical protein